MKNISQKNCLKCNAIFNDKSNAQRAKYCSLKCKEAYLYITNLEKRKLYSKAYKACIYRKMVEKENNRRWYKAHKEAVTTYGLKYSKNNRHIKNKIQAKRRAVKLRATPSWLNKEQLNEMAELYILARELAWLNQDGQSFHVDHIIPLQGKEVCGLHVPWNLQLLSWQENLTKYNALEIKTAETIPPSQSNSELDKID